MIQKERERGKYTFLNQKEKKMSPECREKVGPIVEKTLKNKNPVLADTSAERKWK